MKQLILSILLISGLSMFAQTGDVTVYSNSGKKFYVVLNGIRQNTEPQTNVKITDLPNPYYKCKIIAADKSFELDKNLVVKFDTLITYEVKEKKGKYKMRFYSETAMNAAPKATPDQSTVVYHSTDAPAKTTTVNTNQGGMNTQVNTNTTTGNTSTTTMTTTSTTTNLKERPDNSESIDMNISVGENGLSTNVNINGVDNGQGTTRTDVNTSETITTTSSSSSTINGNTTYEETMTTTTTTTENGNTVYHEEITTTTTNNGANVYQEGNMYQDNDMSVTLEPMTSCFTSDQEVDALVKQVQGESFPDDQLRVANTAAKNKCMSAAQIKKVAQVFDHSEEQLSFLKTAYDKCSNQSNYYQLMDVLTFSSDKEELEKFINSRR